MALVLSNQLYWIMKLGDFLGFLGCSGIAAVLVPFALRAPTLELRMVRCSFAWFIVLMATYNLVLVALIWLPSVAPLVCIKLIVGVSMCMSAVLYWTKYR